MGTSVYVGENEDWAKAMGRKCACGHKLRDHAFTMKQMPEGYVVLYVSECVLCDYDKEKKEFLCKGFH